MLNQRVRFYQSQHATMTIAEFIRTTTVPSLPGTVTVADVFQTLRNEYMYTFIVELFVTSFLEEHLMTWMLRWTAAFQLLL